MGAPKHDGLTVPGRVVLAHEAAFALGELCVDPALREVRRGEASETLEPRVMQVLVALAKADGAILTRDELIHRCWEGRIVSDDSINRVLSRIRRLADGIGRGSFALETVTKVGYRLRADPAARKRMPASAAARRPVGRRPLLVGMGAAAGAAVLGLGGWTVLRQSDERRRLAQLYYRHGIEARGQNSLAHTEQAVAYFRQATRVDPDYAEAWGALAWGYRALLEYGPRGDSARIAMLTRSAANRALELDGDNADAHAALLLLRPFYRNWADIEPGLRRLLDRHPDHDITRFNLAHVMMETGRSREAIPHLEELAERQPSWPLARMQLFRALFAAGRLDEAEEQIGQALRLWPRRLDIWSTRIRQLLLTGRTSEALAFVDDEPAQPLDSVELIELDRLVALAYASGSSELRRQAVDRLLETAQSGAPAVVLAAVDCAFLREVDTAFALLDGFFFGRGEWGSTRPERISTAFLFNVMTTPLRRDRRFGRLVEETGLEAFWRQTGTQPDYRRNA